MLSSQKLWIWCAVVILLEIHQSWAISLATAAEQPTSERNKSYTPQLALISDDIIQDVIENDTKKIIRVNPLGLPSFKSDANIQNMDSALYKINRNNRKYINMQRLKPINEIQPKSSLGENQLIRRLSLQPPGDKTLKPKHRPKKKNLHFLYKQEDIDGNFLSKSVPVHLAPGAYPVYYVVAKANGHFGKYPLKSPNSPQAFFKYLQKKKMENLPLLRTNEEGM